MEGAFLLALRKLSRRAMTTRELAAYLEKKGITPEEISRVIAACIEKRFLDDTEWMATKVRRLVERRKSRFEIAQFLRRHGFSQEEFGPLLPQENKAVLYELIERRYPQLLSPQVDQNIKRKAIAALMRRGFLFNEIETILKKEKI